MLGAEERRRPTPAPTLGRHAARCSIIVAVQCGAGAIGVFGGGKDEPGFPWALGKRPLGERWMLVLVWCGEGWMVPCCWYL